MYGERISDVRVRFREKTFCGSIVRERSSVSVLHLARNRVVIEFKKKAPVIKRLDVKDIALMSSCGRDLVAAWKEEDHEPTFPNSTFDELDIGIGD